MAVFGSPFSFAYASELGTNVPFLDSEWLELIHYEKTWSGKYVSRVHGKDFFLSAEGPQSPEKEYVATREKFFSGPLENRKKYQCEFLARRDFILAHETLNKEDVLECSEFESWFRRLNGQTLSLVFASGSFAEPAASFGHVFLKLHNPDRKGLDLLDYGINFAARTQNTNGALYALYGLFGYFPGTYGMAPYHHLIKEYTNLEGRDLWEYQLNFTQSEIKHLLKHLLELEKGYFDYFFFDQNCASMISEALQIMRPGLRLDRSGLFWSLPNETVKSIAKAHLIVSRKFRASLKTESERSYQGLAISERQHLGDFVHQKSHEDQSIKELNDKELNAAQYYFSFLGAADFHQYSDLNHRLSLELSKRPHIENSQSEFSFGPPETEPGAMRLSFGVLSDESRSRVTTGLRAVGYDFLDPVRGPARFNRLQILSLDLQSRTIDSTEVLPVGIKSARVFDLFVSRPVSRLAMPFSWSLALERTDLWEVPYKIGYTFEFKSEWQSVFRWSGLAIASLHEVRNDDGAVTGGFESLFLGNITSCFRVFVSHNYLFRGNGPALYSRGGLAWDLIDSKLTVRYEIGHDHWLSFQAYF